MVDPLPSRAVVGTSASVSKRSLMLKDPSSPSDTAPLDAEQVLRAHPPPQSRPLPPPRSMCERVTRVLYTSNFLAGLSSVHIPAGSPPS